MKGVTLVPAAGGELSVKHARVVSWSAIGDGEASLVQRCAAGDESACADLVAEHQRMVVQLAMNLLGDRDEALDLSQEVFLRIFRTIHRFRGQSSLRTWIYRIVVNQARNRQRFWRRLSLASLQHPPGRPEQVLHALARRGRDGEGAAAKFYQALPEGRDFGRVSHGVHLVERDEMRPPCQGRVITLDL